MNKSNNIGNSPTLCNDGKYRWVYELSLYTNPTILFVVLKIMGGIMVGMWLFLTLLTCCDSHDVLVDVVEQTAYFAVFAAGFLVFCTICYYIFALFVGGKYCVLFEMDDDGVMHQQMPYNTKKAQLIGLIAALAGAAEGKPGMVGQGLMVAAKSKQYSDFKNVKSIEVYPGRNVIKVNSTLNYNQVYARDEDFNFVLDYITRHLPPTARIN